MLTVLTLPQRTERGVKRHRHEIRRHTVRHRVQCFVQVAADGGRRLKLGELQAITDRLRYVRRSDLLIARLVGDRVDDRDRLADLIPSDPAGHRVPYSAAGLRGPTPTPRSGSSPLLALARSGSPSRAS